MLVLNDGILIKEYFVNTPKKIINRKLSWVEKQLGIGRQQREVLLSDPFALSLSLVLNKMIDDKVRFKLPVSTEAFWDFEIVHSDRFEKQRQKGRFQEIDFIFSDFTGYALRFYYKAKNYQKSNQIYIGGDLKKKFLAKVNAGEKFYTTKTMTIDDIMEPIYKKYHFLERHEVRNLVLHGYRRLHSSTRFGCTAFLQATKYKLYVYIGGIVFDKEAQFKNWAKKRGKKLRVVQAWKKLPYDGYYYIGLNPTAMKIWVKDNLKSRTKAKFKRVIARKIMEELFLLHREMYIFRFKIKKFKGWFNWNETLDVWDLEYMGKSEKSKFTPSKLTWKELIKEYEKTNS